MLWLGPISEIQNNRGLMPQPVEALLFDLGRVLIELDSARAHRRWAELSGVSVAHIEERYRSHVAGSALFHRHERGEITDAEFVRGLSALFDAELTEAQFVDGWNSIFVGEMPGIREVLARVDARLPLYAFSNTNAVHQAYFSVRFAGLLAPFRKLYLSHELRVRKPDAAAFRAVVADMGIDPTRIAFFDDLAENVAGARASGLLAFQVTSAQEIERALVELGVV